MPYALCGAIGYAMSGEGSAPRRRESEPETQASVFDLMSRRAANRRSRGADFMGAVRPDFLQRAFGPVSAWPGYFALASVSDSPKVAERFRVPRTEEHENPGRVVW
jgi:hypothetical protein